MRGAGHLSVGLPCLLKRPISDRAAHDAKLVIAIDKSVRATDRTYGTRRVWRDVLEDGLACGLHRIERLMRKNAMRARPKRRGKPKDDGGRSVIANKTSTAISRPTIRTRSALSASARNHLWGISFTYIPSAEGWAAYRSPLFSDQRRVRRSMASWATCLAARS
ncbi:IS3 family transposase [Palleronia sp.]|uniref:IS3 family transposase n=1 Tax=Palleronia sp. TaxID=1940284 RepID=UPI0035C8106A